MGRSTSHHSFLLNALLWVILLHVFKKVMSDEMEALRALRKEENELGYRMKNIILEKLLVKQKSKGFNRRIHSVMERYAIRSMKVQEIKNEEIETRCIIQNLGKQIENINEEMDSLENLMSETESIISVLKKESKKGEKVLKTIEQQRTYLTKWTSIMSENAVKRTASTELKTAAELRLKELKEDYAKEKKPLEEEKEKLGNLRKEQLKCKGTYEMIAFEYTNIFRNFTKIACERYDVYYKYAPKEEKLNGLHSLCFLPQQLLGVLFSTDGKAQKTFKIPLT